jgi:DNA polymerase-3 subunit delta'
MSAVDVLSTHLCPWLRPALGSLEDARARERLGHGWLLEGPPGIGKLNLALVAAHRWLHGSAVDATVPVLEPAEAAAAMRERHAPADHHPDLHWIFPEEDKATIAVEQIRDAIDALWMKAYHGETKVLVIEPAEAMTIAAANALLKTLEEPTPGTYLLLVSHQPGGLPATIRSRCQRLAMPRPSAATVREWLGPSVPPRIFDELWLLAGGAPLKMASLADGDVPKLVSGLEGELIAVSEDRQDPHLVAARWIKDDLELLLQWLSRRIQRVIRYRMATGASTAVTDRSSDALHNAWRKLTLNGLFEQHRLAEQLLSELHTGRNVELALCVLLMGFHADRGAT